MERFTKKFADGKEAYCEEIIDVGIKGINYPTYVGKAVNKLAEYEDLEEEGKLMIIPCAVGNTVWDNDFGKPCSYMVTGFSFGKIDDDEENDIEELQMYYRNWNGSLRCSCAISEIGKTVFLTKEEAEVALKAMAERV